jgi:hypothetical protein
MWCDVVRCADSYIVDHSYLYLGDVGPTRQLTLRKLLFNERKLLRDSSQGPDPAPDAKDFVRDVRYLGLSENRVYSQL